MKPIILLSLEFILMVTTDEGLLAQSFPNIYIHPNPTTFQFEPSIATHPSNPNIVLVAPVALNNNVSRIGWYYSTDGGNTWMGRDTLPTHTNLSTQMTDPTAGIDLNGNLFISGIYGTTNIFVARRDTAGVWAQTIAATPLQAERPHMAINQNPASPYRNYIYLVYSDVGQPQPRPALFVRSTDQGQTFSTPVTISGTFAAASNFGANLAVGADSTLYATWSGFDAPPWNNPPPQHLGFNMSIDGGATWGTARDLRLIEYSGSAHGVSFFNHPVMAVDRSSGPRRGWIYIAYAERNPSAPDIFLIRSSNHGSTWSDPVKVNQDSDTTKDQWQPWISVDPDSGNVFVVYLDARNFLGNDSAEVYLSASTDGGFTFNDILISDVPFLPTAVFNAPPVAPNYMGSYIGVTSLRDTVQTCWNDNRTGLMLEGRRLHQVYASRIVFPITSVREVPGEMPTEFRLEQNFPNPFNPSTKIKYSIPQSTKVTIKVFDVLGKEVAILVNEEKPIGAYEINWNAESFPSGVYFYQIRAGSFIKTNKMILMK